MKKLVKFVFAFSLLIVFSGSYSSDDQNLDESTVEEISDLFLARDKSVLDNNLNDFLNTQLDNKDIYGGSAKGYIECSKMITNVLKTTAITTALTSRIYEGLKADYVVFVKEDYDRDNKYSHSGFILYYFANTPEGLRITDTNVSSWEKFVKSQSEEKQ